MAVQIGDTQKNQKEQGAGCVLISGAARNSNESWGEKEMRRVKQPFVLECGKVDLVWDEAESKLKQPALIL